MLRRIKARDKILQENGQSVVEIALLLPVLILLLCLIIDSGWIFGNKLLMEFSSREGARFGVVCAADANFENRVTDRVKTTLPGTVASKVSVTAELTTPSTPRMGDVRVLVSYPVTLLTPLASTILHKQTLTVSSSCVMKAE